MIGLLIQTNRTHARAPFPSTTPTAILYRPESPHSPSLPISLKPSWPGLSSQFRQAAPRPHRICLRSRFPTCSSGPRTGTHPRIGAQSRGPSRWGCFSQPCHRRRCRRRRCRCGRGCHAISFGRRCPCTFPQGRSQDVPRSCLLLRCGAGGRAGGGNGNGGGIRSVEK